MPTDAETYCEAGEAARATTRAIAEGQGATREKALKVIGKAMDTGLRKTKPDMNVGLKGADMALKIHDAYPTERKEVTHKGRLDHVHHMTDEELNDAITELEEIEVDE